MSRKKDKSYKLPQLRLEVKVNRSKKVQTSRVVGPFRLIRRNDRYDDDVSWCLEVKKKRKYHKIGHISLTSKLGNDNATPAVAYAEMYEEHFMGMGLMKQCYRILANHYGSLESDVNGDTSDAAKRIWIALKAKRLRGGRYRIEADK